MANNGNRTHTLRILKDVREFYIQKPTGIYIIPEESNICLIHALIIGPKDTPYENGFFYFVLRYETFTVSAIIALIHMIILF